MFQHRSKTTHHHRSALHSLRGVFEEHLDRPFEERWALAKRSDGYLRLNIRSKVAARVLFASVFPPLLVAVLLDRGVRGGGHAITVDASHPLRLMGVSLCIILYILVIVLLAWKLGIARANRELGPPSTDKVISS